MYFENEIKINLILYQLQTNETFLHHFLLEVKSCLFHHSFKITQAENNEKIMRSSRSTTPY